MAVSSRYNIITVDPDEARTSAFLSLRQLCQPVDPHAPETGRIIRKLFECLDTWEQKGVGLSAPQVGILARIFVVNIPPARRKAADAKAAEARSEGLGKTKPLQVSSAQTDAASVPKPDPPPVRMAVINPVFSELSGEKEKAVEGCLSIPGVQGLVPRHVSLRMQGIDEHGAPIDISVSGFLARVFQHEVDHLDGVLFIDRMDEGDPLEESRPPAPKPEAVPVVAESA